MPSSTVNSNAVQDGLSNAKKYCTKINVLYVQEILAIYSRHNYSHSLLTAFASF